MNSQRVNIIRLDSYARLDDYTTFKTLFLNPESPTCKPTPEAIKLTKRFLITAIEECSVNVVNFLLTLLENLKVIIPFSLISRTIQVSNDDITILDRLLRNYTLTTENTEEVLRVVFEKKKYFTLVYLLKTGKIYPGKLDLKNYESIFISDFAKKQYIVNCTILVRIFQKYINLEKIYVEVLNFLVPNYERMENWAIDSIKLILSKSRKNHGDHLKLINKVRRDYFLNSSVKFEENVFADSSRVIYILSCMRDNKFVQINTNKFIRFIKSTVVGNNWNNHTYKSLIETMAKYLYRDSFEELLELISINCSLDDILYYSRISPQIPEVFYYPKIFERVLNSHRKDPNFLQYLNMGLKLFTQLEFKRRSYVNMYEIFEILLNYGADPSHTFSMLDIIGEEDYRNIHMYYLTFMYHENFPQELIEMALKKR